LHRIRSIHALAVTIEALMLARRIWFAALPLLLVVCWLLIRKLTRDTPDFEKELLFENVEEKAVQTLGI
jgi:hypothetical protein